jgi:hypothetical protein
MAMYARITPAAALKRMLGGIRAECAKQGIDDDTRRALMARVAGVSSSKDLTLKDAKQVLWHLQKCSDGARPDAKKKAALRGTPEEWKFVFSQPPEKQPLLKKIYRLAETIGGLQSPPVPVIPKCWVEGVAGRMRGVGARRDASAKVITRLEMCTGAELATLIQAMAVYVRRQESGARNQK